MNLIFVAMATVSAQMSPEEVMRRAHVPNIVVYSDARVLIVVLGGIAK
jgi:hypothetical protein